MPDDVTDGRVLDLPATPRVEVVVTEWGAFVRVDGDDGQRVYLDVSQLESVAEALQTAFHTWNRIAVQESKAPAP